MNFRDWMFFDGYRYRSCLCRYLNTSKLKAGFGLARNEGQEQGEQGEQGARSKEQGARSKEQGAGSREQGAHFNSSERQKASTLNATTCWPSSLFPLALFPLPPLAPIRANSKYFLTSAGVVSLTPLTSSSWPSPMPVTN